MRMSKYYAPTLKEVPNDAEIKSHELLIRGGFIRKTASGVYTYLPLGFKVLKKIEQIVREEMENIDSQEILMPIIQPAEIWQESGRWDDYGPEMMKLKDRHNRDFTLGIFEESDELEREIEKVDTPNVKTIEDVANFLNVDNTKIVKSLLFKGRDGWILALIRGDYELNISKLRAYFGDQTLTMGEPEEIKNEFGVEIGFIGPVGIENVKIVADYSIKNMKNFVVGGMEKDKHYINVNINKDFKVDSFTDIRMVSKGEPCPKCSKPLKEIKGIEVGQVFKLGTKYSEKLHAYYTSEDGKQKPFIMGCYGWGISRTLGAIVEQLHDDYGMIWPKSISPFEVVIIPVSMKQKELVDKAEELYKILKEKYDALYDDRDASPGFKFKDADLIGIPLKIILGKKMKDGKVEVKLRYEKNSEEVDISNGFDELLKIIEKKLNEYDPKIYVKTIDKD
ncbi:MAG: hypothetical protein B6I29_02775 [Marinitoga sp. 4572_148]|nr:MAG: hypothetical protein B6I29_02775 [Marinitoga sp. 4572_148]